MKGNIENESDSGDLRCCCGSLIARVVKNYVEIKCRRCKRIDRISIEGGKPAMSAGRIEKVGASPAGEKRRPADQSRKNGMEEGS